MRKCAFLTMDSLEDFFSYDTMLIEPMRREGWQVEEVSWKSQNINWADFEVVIIRSTWDYQDDVDNFIRTLEKIDKQTRLENNLELVKWNICKDYLKDLDDAKAIRLKRKIKAKEHEDNLQSVRKRLVASGVQCKVGKHLNDGHCITERSAKHADCPNTFR